MPTTIALYGDSYVVNLRNHCNSNLRVPATVYWFGKGGLRTDFKKRDGKIDTDAQAMYSRMIDLRPNVAFINVSGNDRTTDVKPRDIFNRVVRIVDDLQAAGVSYFCSKYRFKTDWIVEEVSGITVEESFQDLSVELWKLENLLQQLTMTSLWQKVQEGSPANVKLYVAVATTAVGVVYVVRRWMVWSKVSKKIKRKRAKCQAAFEKVENSLKALELDGDESLKILNLTSTELQQALHDGSLKAVDVLHVYQARALEVNKRLNAVTEPLLDADSMAAACDSFTGEKGLLHGIPVSLKESYCLRNNDTTAGLGQFIGEIAAEDAVLVKVLKKQGAVPYVRTNIPQLMMTYECSNPIFGQTHNPYDSSRGPGGSTGGEGALIGSGASVIGFGSDIGGSIRVPCHMCGCYGLKTTLERLSRKGSFSLSKGQMQVSGTVGPMARDLDGLVLAMKALLCEYHFELDPKVPPIHFRTEIYESTKPLKIGFYVHDGYVKPVPACQRAVLMAKAALESRGHTVVEFRPPNIKYVYPNLYLGTVIGDGARTYNTVMKKDIYDPVVKQLLFGTTWPKALQRITAWVLQFLYKDPVYGEALRKRSGHGSVYDWFRHAEALQVYKEEFLSAWREQKLDGVICPVFATTAVPHGKIIDILASGMYSMLYNVLNYPAGSMPVTKVTADDVINMKDYPTMTHIEKTIHKITTGSEGLPVNVQCAGLPYQEELVLRIMKEVELGLGK